VTQIGKLLPDTAARKRWGWHLNIARNANQYFKY
jgi:hypothetical protein